MRNFKTIAIALLVAFGTTVSAQEKKIDVSKSDISWVGKKVTGQHSGNVSLTAGSLLFKGKKLVGGDFDIDMNSITVTDLKAGQGKEKLEGHLKADDFFGTDKYPAAHLAFKTVTAKTPGVYTVTADLTLKGITKPVAFDLTVGKNSATTALVIDRTKYDIKYKSKSFFDSLGDNVIYDDFEVKVNLVF
jgi:polyisoprenoid-binding protein YceI